MAEAYVYDHLRTPRGRGRADGALHPVTPVRHGERVVFSAEFGPSVSANPFLRFRFKGAAAGDRLVASWVDSRGETRSDQVQIGGAAA